jgi:predicted O-linked N-acetylglucosamine transferase (SPINDLY family)
VTGQSNEAVADRVAAAGIHLLVDLNAYSASRRLGIYPLRPAPRIVGWFNYYGTSGLDCFDYLIADESVLPASEERYYTERILRVPHSYLTFEVHYPVPDVAPLPMAASGQVTMGCLASQYKLTDQVIATWAGILCRCPGVRMLIRNATLDRPENQRHLRDRFARHGVGGERLLLEGPAEHAEFLRTYDRIDFAVDPFPYSGGTTTMEALWQGVPVVTFDGGRWASRTSLSLLRAAGLEEFVGRDLEEYTQMCVRLATAADTSTRLRTFRAGIRERLRRSAVCDAVAFARAMEEQYLRVLRANQPTSGA